MSINLSEWLSLWGALLSTVLAFLKIKEEYNNWFRIGTSYVFCDDDKYGNDISIQNLSNTPVLLDYMVVYSIPKGFFSFFSSKDEIWSPEDEILNDRIEPQAAKIYHFVNFEHFDWKNKKIYVKLNFAGKKVIVKRINK